MKFECKRDIDDDAFLVTQGAWMAQLGQNPESSSATYYQAGLDYCHRMIKGETPKADGGGCVCAVYGEGLTYASALLVVSHAKAQNNLKMLDIYVQPDLNLADREPKFVELAWIAAVAIVECLEMTYDTYPADQLKMLTAFPLDKQFMTAIATAIFQSGTMAQHYDLSSHGNWLVVTKKAGPDGEHRHSRIGKIDGITVQTGSA